MPRALIFAVILILANVPFYRAMAKQSNRAAWRLAGLLAILVLIGSADLGFSLLRRWHPFDQDYSELPPQRAFDLAIASDADGALSRRLSPLPYRPVPGIPPRRMTGGSGVPAAFWAAWSRRSLASSSAWTWGACAGSRNAFSNTDQRASFPR